MRANRLSLLVLILGITLGQSACGFRLAGTADLPEQVASIYLVDNGFSEPQRRVLRRRLTQAGATLAETADTDSVKLNVSLKVLPDRRMATSASTGTLVTRITRQLDYTVTAAGGEPLVPLTTLTQQKDVSLDDDRLLSSDREKESAIQDLEMALYDQLIRQLALL